MYAEQAGCPQDLAHGDGPGCIMPVDLENAYCRAHRSSMLRAGRSAAPTVAATAAAQWQRGQPTTAWLFTCGAWRRVHCYRGAWQGSRLSQALFVASLEEAQQKAEQAAQLEECRKFEDNNACPFQVQPPLPEAERSRVALQDDTTYVGRAGALLRLYPHLVRELEAIGHRMRPHKCCCWLPGYDKVPPPIPCLIVPRTYCSRFPEAWGELKSLAAMLLRSAKCIQTLLPPRPQRTAQRRHARS